MLVSSVHVCVMAEVYLHKIMVYDINYICGAEPYCSPALYIKYKQNTQGNKIYYKWYNHDIKLKYNDSKLCIF